MTYNQDLQKPLSNGELSAFCMQLYWIVKAGISVFEGVTMMAEDTDDVSGKAILLILQESLENGNNFSTALTNTGCFPAYMISMVEIGEDAGRLEEVLESLGRYYEQNQSIVKSLRYAVTYPAVMIIMMAVVIGVLVLKVMPIFNQVFIQLGSEMSGFAGGIMSFGKLLGNYSLGIVIVLLALLLLILAIGLTVKGKAALQRFLENSKLTAKLSAKISAGRFASAMAMMLSSGLDMDHAIEMSKGLLTTNTIKTKVNILQRELQEGNAFSDAITKADIFSSVYTRMLVIGVKTGSAENVMTKIASWYEEEVEDQISQTLSIIEPTLVAVLAVIVGMILLSVMLPLMGIMTSIG